MPLAGTKALNPVGGLPETKRTLFSPRFYFQPGLKVHGLYLSPFFLSETEPVENSMSFIPSLLACSLSPAPIGDLLRRHHRFLESRGN